ncbi:MAG TPA: YigZ family protein [Actinomycetales bacterium]|nr:YigZ family protein [Actinomycetales bacterium]
METPRHRPARGSVTTREIEVRRSRFIATVARADTEEAARAVVAAARVEFPDARHHCSAFIVEVPSAQEVERSSDDGEPSGTAGRPMLEVLRGSGLTNVVAVVTRYFGGVKLGTGGLVRAYSDSVSTALDGVPRVRVVTRALRTLALPHAEAGRIRSELEARGAGSVDVVDVAYGREAVFTLATDDPDALAAMVAALTSGGGVLVDAGEREVEVRV